MRLLGSCLTFAVAALTLPPSNVPLTRSVNSLQLKCSVEPSAEMAMGPDL